METPYWCGGTHAALLAAADKPSKDAFILYHGFPGEPPPHEIEKYRHLPKKAVDVARAVHEFTRLDGHLPHYQGLGESRGKFSFTGSIEQSIAFAGNVESKGYARIHVIGNSWGGLVGFNVWRALGDRRGLLVLIAPLADLESPEMVRLFLPRFVKDYPHILGHDAGALPRAVEDVCRVLSRYNPLTFAKMETLPADAALIIHGNKDQSVKIEISRRLAAVFPCRFVELAADHSFTANRQEMIDEVLKFFSEKIAPRMAQTS